MKTQCLAPAWWGQIHLLRCLVPAKWIPTQPLLMRTQPLFPYSTVWTKFPCSAVSTNFSSVFVRKIKRKCNIGLIIEFPKLNRRSRNRRKVEGWRRMIGKKHCTAFSTTKANVRKEKIVNLFTRSHLRVSLGNNASKSSAFSDIPIKLKGSKELL